MINHMFNQLSDNIIPILLVFLLWTVPMYAIYTLGGGGCS